MNAKQRAYIRRVEDSNPDYVIESLERADGTVIVDVRQYVKRVPGFPLDGLRSRAQILIDQNGSPMQ